jgi:hypothetical protein
MKTILNFFVVAALIVAGLVSNVANVSAQPYEVTPVDTFRYHNGVEKYIGAVVPGSGEVLHFYDVGFVDPSGAGFTSASYSLASGASFYLSDVIIYPTADTLYLRINFTVASNVPLGDVLDTLTISSTGADPFVLPLRGSSVLFASEPTNVPFDPVLEDETSALAKPVTVTSASSTLVGITYSLTGNPGSAFSIAEEGRDSTATLSHLFLGVSFTPPSAGPAGTIFYDTLFISHSGSARVDSIPIQGTGTQIVSHPQILSFQRVPVGDTRILPLEINTLAEIYVGGVTISDGVHYILYKNDLYPDGGTLQVRFLPDTIRPYFTADLTVPAEGIDTFHIPVVGGGGPLPVIWSDLTSFDFGAVEVGTSALSGPVTVTLTHPYNRLSDPDNFSFTIDNGIFRVETIQPTPYFNPDTVYLTLSFNPNAVGTFNDTLVVHALYADDYFIPVTGTGFHWPSLSPQQATAISAVETGRAPSLQVREGDIIVSQAPAGSSIQVYNLQGQSLKTQAVASDVEVLKTAAFPKSVYIVLVNDRKEVILKQKVLL